MSNPIKNDEYSPAKRAGIALVMLVCVAGLLLWSEPAQLYDWIKALHVITIVSWMAGMLYLPRLFVYHAGVPMRSAQSEMLKVMEDRLLRLIMNPAMILTWIFGLWLAWHGFGFIGTWLILKLFFVLSLTACHGYLSKTVRLFAQDRNEKTARHWRIVNEVPTVLMIAIIVLVIVKPF